MAKAHGGKPRSTGWILPRPSVLLALVAIGTPFISCSDESNEGCGSACSRTWRLCQAELHDAQGQAESDFTSACVDTCRNAASDNARQLAQDLGCITKAGECLNIKECPTIGPLVGIASFGGGGFAGGGFGVGGFAECQDGTTPRSCTCTNGRTGTQRCQASRWGACSCSGTGGTTSCSDSCFYSNNRICDDGALNAATARCYFGTDCTDCGVRYGAGGIGGMFGSGGFATGGRRFDASVDAPASGGRAGDADASATDATSVDVSTSDAPVNGG